jgi:GNAT superfamily N-acetyltransferase
VADPVTAPLVVVPFAPGFEPACAGLIAGLPDWFGIPESNAAFLRELASLPSFVTLRGADVVGAATLREHAPGSLEISFMAVRADCHRQGIGRRLLEHLESEARRRQGRWLHVRTLAPSHPDPFYARTRAFYLALGFAPLFESDALWGPANPALVLLKAL